MLVRLPLHRYLPSLASSGLNAAKLTQPFSRVIESTVTDPFIRNWLDLLCFLLSGLPANGTVAAEVAFMFNEWLVSWLTALSMSNRSPAGPAGSKGERLSMQRVAGCCACSHLGATMYPASP